MADMASQSKADAALACLTSPYTRAVGSRPFSSDLSVDEAVLLKHIGYDQRGLVAGSCIVHVGLKSTNWGQNQEVEALTGAMYHARTQAIGRLASRAREIGATGVIGVRLDIRLISGAKHFVEFTAIGTAVSRESNPAGHPAGALFTSDLSGQDLYNLTRAGYDPVGLVVGACVYHVAHQGLGQFVAMRTTTQNIEMTQFTEALYEARELAMGRMQDEAQTLGAHGVVAMKVTQQSHAWGSHIIEFLALGTAVRLTAKEHVPANPNLVVSLGGPEPAVNPDRISEASGSVE
jgi:uncharacterized protein YbjQ (UPF0145 family)